MTDDKELLPRRAYRAWEKLGDSRALIAGVAVLGAAVVWGAAQAVLISFATYRQLKKRPARTHSVEQGVSELVESVIWKIGRAIVRPSPSAAFALRVVEVGGLAYLGYRALKKRRLKRPATRILERPATRILERRTPRVIGG